MGSSLEGRSEVALGPQYSMGRSKVTTVLARRGTIEPHFEGRNNFYRSTELGERGHKSLEHSSEGFGEVFYSAVASPESGRSART